MQLVPVLPVVTKADTMTIKECIAYRTDLHQRLQYPALPGRTKPISLFHFSPTTLAECGLEDNAIASAAAMRPPYLVVCSNLYNEDKLKQAEPELWPERRYMWGTSEAMNPQHSDLLLLRRLLLQEGVEEISRSKISRCAPVPFLSPASGFRCSRCALVHVDGCVFSALKLRGAALQRGPTVLLLSYPGRAANCQHLDDSVQLTPNIDSAPAGGRRAIDVAAAPSCGTPAHAEGTRWRPSRV